MTTHDDLRATPATVSVDGETIRLGTLTVLTDVPTALRKITRALGSPDTVHIERGHDRGDAIRTAIQLAACRGTLVTIDTFECGLHYTELGSGLAALYEALTKHGVQVALPTQSTEMIEALARLCETHPDADVRVTKCGTGLPEAPSLKPDEIRIALKQRLEVR